MPMSTQISKAIRTASASIFEGIILSNYTLLSVLSIIYGSYQAVVFFQLSFSPKELSSTNTEEFIALIIMAVVAVVLLGFFVVLIRRSLYYLLDWRKVSMEYDTTFEGNLLDEYWAANEGKTGNRNASNIMPSFLIGIGAVPLFFMYPNLTVALVVFGVYSILIGIIYAYYLWKIEREIKSRITINQ